MPDLTRPGEHTESSLCGCLLLDNSYIGQIADTLEAKDFYGPKERALYVAILRAWGEGKTVDPACAASYLPPTVDGGIAWEAHASVGSAALAPHFAKQIADASLRRRLASEAASVVKMAKEDERDAASVVGDGQQRVLGVQGKESAVSLSDIWAGLTRRSEEAAKHPGGLVGASYGIRSLNNVTGGMRSGQLIVLAARTGIGKSAIAKSCMVMGNIMEDDNTGMAVFTGEDSAEAFTLRCAAQLSRIDYNRLDRGDLSPDEWARYTEACGTLEQRTRDRLLLDDRPRPTPGYIMNRVRQWRNAGKPMHFVVIDYLQVMGDVVSGSEYERKTALAYACQALARDLDLPVVLVAQLSRAAEGRDEIRPPVLTDLKATGALEEAANVVLLLHRESRGAISGTLWVAKNKNGPVGDCKLSYSPTTTTFKEA